MRKEKMTIDVYTGMKFVRELKKEGYSLKMLVVCMREAFDKHDNGEKLNLKERFILGLRYSEFLAIKDTEEAYMCAEIKRMEYLKVLGIDPEKLRVISREIVGLY